MNLTELTADSLFEHVVSWQGESFVDLQLVDHLPGLYTLRTNHPALAPLDRQILRPSIIAPQVEPVGFVAWAPIQADYPRLAVRLLALAQVRVMDQIPGPRLRLECHRIGIALATLRMVLKSEPIAAALAQAWQVRDDLTQPAPGDLIRLLFSLSDVFSAAEAIAVAYAPTAPKGDFLPLNLRVGRSYAEAAATQVRESLGTATGKLLETTVPQVVAEMGTPHVPDLAALDYAQSTAALSRDLDGTELLRPAQLLRDRIITGVWNPPLIVDEPTAPNVADMLAHRYPRETPNTTGRPLDGIEE